MDITNSTNILDSKDQVLKLENLPFETSLELEKATHEIYVPNFSKNEKNEGKTEIHLFLNYLAILWPKSINDNSAVNENLNNADDPTNWSSKKKLLILSIVTICGISTPIAGTIHFPALVVIQKDFNVSVLVIDAFGSVFTFFLGAGPIVWAACSDELATRKKVYVASLLVYVAASVVCALATNIWLLIAMRAIQSCGNSSILPLSAGVISDIYGPLERGRAFGIFYFVFWIGPFLATILGGFIAQYLGWRCIFLDNPNLRFNPIAPLKLFKYPNITLIITYICISTLLIHIQNISIPINFSARYNFTTSEIGIYFIAPSFGYMFGSLFGGKYSDFLSKKAILISGGDYCPEVRIKSAWFNSLLIPITCFIYGWLLDINFNIYVLGSFGMLGAFNTLSTYLVDACPGRGASVMALVSLIRFGVPGVLTIFETSIEESLGVRWMFTLISIICFLSISLLIIVYINGKKWRSKFVVTT
ncbi:24491_t:CDS:2 [Racocetra persica]|uniref:24491_t:CDS:1 n=1 Tax=Racocetra persica TaxID=160502 RepID=A0ACA9L3K5_9GLOM|nr:24491_t:CDS:2 [Racocetra persica]